MSTEGVTLGGVDVATGAIRAADLSGLIGIPERRGSDTMVPGRHGAVRTPRKRYGVRRLVIDFWVHGANPDGTVPADRHARFYANLDTLTQLLALDTLTLLHTLPDQSVRQLTVEPVAGIEPRRWLEGSMARVPVAFDAADPFWADTALTQVTFSLATGATRVLTELACTAPIDDATVTFGPGANPRLEQTSTGAFTRYGAVIGADRTLIVNSALWQLSGTGGLVPDYLAFSHGPNTRWVVLDPVPGGAPTVTLTHTGGGTVQTTIAGRRKWLVG